MEIRKELKKETCSIQELAEKKHMSHAKAREITSMKNFPAIKFGRERRVILSELDEFLEWNGLSKY